MLAMKAIGGEESFFVPAILADVVISEGFWRPIQETTLRSTLPAIIAQSRSSGRWQSLRWKPGHKIVPHKFWDSDIYKIVEAACYLLIHHTDETLRNNVDEAVENIKMAQHSNGYINSHFTVANYDERFTNTRDKHELYCLGHLLEATVAYSMLYESSQKLLDITMRYVGYVDAVFGLETDKKSSYPGHEEVELGLLRLFEMTKAPILLKLAKYFIEIRGQRSAQGEIYWDQECRDRGLDPYVDMFPTQKFPRDYTYWQAHKPVVEQAHIVGHCVRAVYLGTAATQLLQYDKNENMHKAMNRLFQSCTERKMYITGGIGSDPLTEGFGDNYVLPDGPNECYGETCASVGLFTWAARFGQIKHAAHYGAIMERCLYNAILGSVSIDGTAFFYENVLRIKTDQVSPELERQKWFSCACCPPNVARLFGSLGMYCFSYNTAENTVKIDLHMSSIYKTPIDNIVRVISDIPNSGRVHLSASAAVKFAVRIPEWSLSISLTMSAESEKERSTSIPDHVEKSNGYLAFNWPENFHGHLDVDFHLRPTIIRKPEAERHLGRDEVCVQRGPIVYCAESIDNPDLDIDQVEIIQGTATDGTVIDIQGKQVTTVLVAVAMRSRTQRADEASPATSELTMIMVPYWARMNRIGSGAFRVWFSRSVRDATGSDTNTNFELNLRVKIQM